MRKRTENIKYILSSRSYIDQIIALRKEGKGISEIGRILKRNHTTILYWFRRIDALDPLFSYAPKHKREFTASDLFNKSEAVNSRLCFGAYENNGSSASILLNQ